jgi:hypothetical protein
VAAALGLFVVLLGQHGADDTDEGVTLGEDADHVGAPPLPVWTARCATGSPALGLMARTGLPPVELTPCLWGCGLLRQKQDPRENERSSGGGGQSGLDVS